MKNKNAERKGRQINTNDPDKNPLLRPPRLNLETGEGLKEFLEWLNDPEVDKAFEQAFPIADDE